MSFTAADVKTLREMTSVGMMDCKKALTECDGDMDKAMSAAAAIEHFHTAALIHDDLDGILRQGGSNPFSFGLHHFRDGARVPVFGFDGL